MLHSNVEPGSVELKVKDGTARLDGSEGLVRIVVLGAVRSTSTLRIAVAGCPALTVETVARTWVPSAAGIDHEKLY
jgi:hypothetical protein